MVPRGSASGTGRSVPDCRDWRAGPTGSQLNANAGDVATQTRSVDFIDDLRGAHRFKVDGGPQWRIFQGDAVAAQNGAGLTADADGFTAVVQCAQRDRFRTASVEEASAARRLAFSSAAHWMEACMDSLPTIGTAEKPRVSTGTRNPRNLRASASR